MAKLEFYEDTHTYTLDGKIVPSVTQVINAVGLYEFEFVNRNTLAVAAERGLIVHECIEFFERGELDETSIDPELRGYFEAYLECRKVYFPQGPIAIEERVYSEQYQYAGTLDQEFSGGWINDIKTGAPSPTHGLQLTGYWLAKHGKTKKPTRLTGTYLQPGGRFRLKDYPYEPGAWLAVLADYRWRHKYNLLKKV